LDVKWERRREKKVDGWIEEERRKRRGFSDRGRLTCVLRNKIIEQSSKRPEGLWEGENRSNFFGGEELVQNYRESGTVLRPNSEITRFGEGPDSEIQSTIQHRLRSWLKRPELLRFSGEEAWWVLLISCTKKDTNSQKEVPGVICGPIKFSSHPLQGV
jgi:hypothetical protein